MTPIDGKTLGLKSAQAIRDLYARNLRKRMLERDLYQSALADLAGVNRDIISKACRAKNLPNALNREKIAKALLCSPDDLLPRHLVTDDPDIQSAPYSLQAHGTDGKLVWLKVDKLVEAKTGTAVIALLNEDKAPSE